MSNPSKTISGLNGKSIVVLYRATLSPPDSITLELWMKTVMENDSNSNSSRRAFDALPSYEEAVPTYDESISQSHPPPPVLEQVQSPLFSDTSSVSSSSYLSAGSPSNSASAVTLVLFPDATLIFTLSSERAMYELTAPLDGQIRSVFIAEVPIITKLSASGHLPQIEKRHHLYKIFESQEGGTKHTAIDGRKTRCMQGTMLRRSADGTALVATNHGGTWGRNSGELIYSARRSGRVMEWINAKGSVVAIDHMATDRSSQETLEVLVPLSRKWLDMLVAVWISRIHQDVLREADEKQRESNARDGKQRGLLDGMRGSFGLRYGVQSLRLGARSTSEPIHV